jgi:hypothetical protein
MYIISTCISSSSSSGGHIYASSLAIMSSRFSFWVLDR